MNSEFVEKLKTANNIDIYTHSGSYELVKQAITMLAKLPYDKIDVSDLEMLFHFGNLRHGKDARNKDITESNLSADDKQALISLNNKISLGDYTNSRLENFHRSNGNCGLFAKGKTTLKSGNSDKQTAQLFIKMLIDISTIDDEQSDEIFHIVDNCLKQPLKGLGAGIASQILHLLKPNVFPVLNSVGVDGYKNKIGMPLLNNNLDNYIENTKIISAFRAESIPELNYRSVDVAVCDSSYSDAPINNNEQQTDTVGDNLQIAAATKAAPLPQYTKADFLSDIYMSSDKYDEIISLLNRKKNIILQGAPGVGKSYLAKRLAYSLIGEKDDSRVEMIQFHQSYSYEDFIQGFRPDGKGGFSLENGVFYEFCMKAKKDLTKPYYFIIDEINRGNLSKIMGELMLLIENDKRNEEYAAKLTYAKQSDERFYVPENVFIIGMMNTADRSLAMIDYALRRRFSFVPIEPAFNNKDFIEYIKRDDAPLGEKILADMTALNVDIRKDLGEGFQIGHSYFCNCDNITIEWYESIFKYEISPLLDEYWFDNDKQRSKWIKELLPGENNPD